MIQNDHWLPAACPAWACKKIKLSISKNFFKFQFVSRLRRLSAFVHRPLSLCTLLHSFCLEQFALALHLA